MRALTKLAAATLSVSHIEIGDGSVAADAVLAPQVRNGTDKAVALIAVAEIAL